MLENYHTPDGLEVPKVLRKYIPSEPEFLPFMRDLPRNSASTRREKVY